VLVSATQRTGLPELGQALVKRLELSPRHVRLRFPASDARAIAGVYSAGRVVSHEVHGSDVHIDAEIPERLLERYRAHLL
jgi:50S ribosomal subunit-associated GTPase HflX